MLLVEDTSSFDKAVIRELLVLVYLLCTIFIGYDGNGHVERDADGYGGVHGGMTFGTKKTLKERGF